MRNGSITQGVLGGLVMLLAVTNCVEVPAAEPVVVTGEAREELIRPEVRWRSIDLVELARQTADDTAVLERLDALLADPALQPVATDAVLYDFVHRLRLSEPWLVGPGVLSWLQRHRPLAVTIHDESPVYQVALFNVAGAAQGLENQWVYQTARTQWLEAGENISASSLRVFVESPHGPRAAGYRAALEALSPASLDRLIGLIEAEPAVQASVIYPAVAMAHGQTWRVADWLVQANAEIAAEVLALSVRLLAPADTVVVLRAGMDHSDAAIRSLAVARMTGVAAELEQFERDAWVVKLVELLADPRLGGTAALQLSRLADSTEVQEIMQQEDLSPLARQHLEMIPALRPLLVHPPGQGSGQR